MRLSEFIREHMDDLLSEWEAFAATRTPAASGMASKDLRNHARQILEAIATDLSQPETERQRTDKSHGLGPVEPGSSQTAAEVHALLRGRSGFDINQLVSEFRALRASVLRQWEQANDGEIRHGEDVIRFGEAIDQALEESVRLYSAEVEHARSLLLAMIGHDLRGPLCTVHHTAMNMASLDVGDDVAAAAKRLATSSARMSALLDDLQDFNRARLGLTLRVSAAAMDLGKSFADEVEMLRAAHPGRPIEFAVDGDVTGCWDERRLQQVLSNLVVNAVKHGAAEGSIRIRVSGCGDHVQFEVENPGGLDSSIGTEALFDPLRRGTEGGTRPRFDSLGMGLYISREIARAQGGQIECQTREGSTVFAVTLPRVAGSLRD